MTGFRRDHREADEDQRGVDLLRRLELLLDDDVRSGFEDGRDTVRTNSTRERDASIVRDRNGTGWKYPGRPRESKPSARKRAAT
jgi:hypothetical protein